MRRLEVDAKWTDLGCFVELVEQRRRCRLGAGGV